MGWIASRTGLFHNLAYFGGVGLQRRVRPVVEGKGVGKGSVKLVRGRGSAMGRGRVGWVTDWRKEKREGKEKRK